MTTRHVAATLLACCAASAHAAFNDTGQTACYSNTGTTACSDPAFPGQDARYGRDAAQAAGQLPPKTGGGRAGFDFTARSASGSPVSPSAGTHPCVRDNVTELTWKTVPQSGLDWSEAASNAATHHACDFDDWRVPTRRELLSIADRSYAVPDSDYFTDGTLFPTWSADSYALDPAGRGWFVYPPGGTGTADKFSTGLVRFVRGPASAATAFNVLPEGTAFDQATDLVWDRCYLGQSAAAYSFCDLEVTSLTYTWQEALQIVAQLNARPGGYKGHSDWRLPNVAELETLIDIASAAESPSDTFAFPGASPSAHYWTSTTYAAELPPIHAWRVNITFGNVDTAEKTELHQVRLVRGGGPWAAFDALAAPPTPGNPTPGQPTPVPTLGHAAPALLSALLGGVGFISRRKKA